MSSSEPERWLLRQVELAGEVVDCRLAGGVVTGLGVGLTALPGERVLAAHGGALLPGLADHHLHLFAAAAAAQSFDLAGAGELPHDPEPAGWLRVIGAGRELDRADLDAAWPNRPVRAQHRSGALWTLNSLAVRQLETGLGAAEKRTGQLWRSGGRLRDLLAAAGETGSVDLSLLGIALARHGITHVTDATPDSDRAALALMRSALPQRVLSLAGGGTGPRKIVLADHTDPDYASLVRQVQQSHGSGRPVAVHAVTAVALAMVIAALDEVGALPGDRVEHAAVCDDDAALRLAELGVTVVTQPTLFARHGATFSTESPPEDVPWLWRYGALARLGVRVAASSDAPYGDIDPWATVSAAVRREPELTAASVLGSMLTDPSDPGGPPREVRPGAAADLCLLAQPLDVALANVTTGEHPTIAATFIGGSLVTHPPGAADASP